MSFNKVCELAEKFEQKLLDSQLSDDEQEAKTKVPSWIADPAIWLRAKKAIKKYWKKYKDPFGAVVNVYYMMGGTKKK